MEKGLCVLVLGVSGTGKTTSCQDFVARNPGWSYIRASVLLSKLTGMSSEVLRTSSDEVIRDNQLLLADALTKLRGERSTLSLIIDGHAVIDNNKSLVPVPISVVAAVKPDGLILLEASASALVLRRQNLERPRPRRSVAELEQHAHLELQTATFYASKLGIPLIRANADSKLQLDPLMAKLTPTRDRN